MVKDGYYYGLGFLAAATVVGWLTRPGWGVPLLVLAGFFMWFFRDPERTIPDTPGALVSPGDGRVTDAVKLDVNGSSRTRVSIFLSVFDVHVNRSPISGVIEDVRYQTGKFHNAMGSSSAQSNEQNIVTVRGEGHSVIFKQIAGVLARRIVFTKKIGDKVQRGERVGLIKFGSRVDVIMDAAADLQVKVGDRVRGGSSVLALLPQLQVDEERSETVSMTSGSRETGGGSR